MGAAGDMLTAALLELLPEEKQKAFFSKFNDHVLEGVAVSCEKVTKCGIEGTHMIVTVNGEEEESVDEHAYHHHDHEEHDHHHHHDHEEHDHHHDHHEHEHHHDHEEHEHHHHEHDENCTCGCHDHDHHHADDVFTSWGKETPHVFEKSTIEHALKAFVETDEYGDILRAKGMVPSTDGTWIYFDLVDGEYEIRQGEPDYTGRLVVIGPDIDEHQLEELFGLN